MSSEQETGTFCPKCGKLRGHPTKEDATVVTVLETDVDWYTPRKSFIESTTDLLIFVNHCVRCGHVLHTKTGPVLPKDDGTPGPRSIEADMETFDSLDEYEHWLENTFDPIDADWTDEPIPIDTASILGDLREQATEKRTELGL